MEAYIPLFPLNLVAFPGEALNLHVFEPRYKELMKDILAGDRRFGVPAYVTNRIEYGTEVEVEQVVRVYPDGRMDIKTLGQRVFKAIEYHNPMEGKLYAGGQVVFQPNTDDRDLGMALELCRLAADFFQLIHAENAPILTEDIRSFELGHKVGLSSDQQYALLQMPRESQRQQYLLGHLQQTIPLLQEVEQTKDRVRMNGHFRHFDPLKF